MILDAQLEGRSLRVEIEELPDGRFRLALPGRTVEVDARETGRGFVSLLIEGRSHSAGLERRPEGYVVAIGHDAFLVELGEALPGAAAALRPAGGPARLRAPMPGKIVRVLVAAGEPVTAGQGLVVMEAMKMENELRSPRAGQVRELGVREGATVEAGQLIAVVE